MLPKRIILIICIFTSSSSIYAEPIKTDVNGDGYITHKEWMETGKQRLEKQFEYQDRNHNDYLEPSEQGLLNLGSKIKKRIESLTNNNDRSNAQKIQASAAKVMQGYENQKESIKALLQKRIKELQKPQYQGMR